MKQSLGDYFYVFLAITFHKSSAFVLPVALNIRAYPGSHHNTLSDRSKYISTVQKFRPVTHRFVMLDPNDLGGPDSTAPLLEAAHNFMVQAFNVQDGCTRIITSVTGIQKIIEYIHGVKAPHKEEYGDQVLFFYCQDMHHCSFSEDIHGKDSIVDVGSTSVNYRGDLRISLLVIGKDILPESILWEALLLAQNNETKKQQHAELVMNFDMEDNQQFHSCQDRTPSIKIENNTTHLKFHREPDQRAIGLSYEQLRNLTLFDFVQLEFEHSSPYCFEVKTE